MLEVAGLKKTFTSGPVIKDLHLSLIEGELLCLLGSSGCGKTTFLRLLAGLEKPDAGSILLDGVDMTHLEPYQRPINMMFQSYALFPHMSVEKNIAFGLAYRNIDKAKKEQLIDQMLELLKLTELRKRKPGNLSGGQKQRVALARSLVLTPRLLLLDEPLAAMDRKLREATQFELMRIQKQTNTTFIVVTHDQTEAMTMASRIGFMQNGDIEQIGEPLELYQNPCSLEVANLIGSCNLISGMVKKNGKGRQFFYETLVIDLSDGQDQGKGTLLVRPEHIHISALSAQSACIKAVIVECIFRGDHVLYQLKVATSAIELQAQVRLKDALYRKGDVIGLSFDVSQLRFFKEQYAPKSHEK